MTSSSRRGQDWTCRQTSDLSQCTTSRKQYRATYSAESPKRDPQATGEHPKTRQGCRDYRTFFWELR
eukprot:11873269-Heterocapsa_arctica.AAC.1